jgi:hypothetical protein
MTDTQSAAERVCLASRINWLKSVYSKALLAEDLARISWVREQIATVHRGNVTEADKGGKVMSFTQDQLTSIWEKLAAGSECDEHGQRYVGVGVSAWIAYDTDVEQILTLSSVAPYSYSSSGGANVPYTRTRLSKGTSWRMWKN